VRIGDTVAIGDESTPVTIVGEALFPNDVHAEFDQGIWLTPTRFASMVPEVGSDDMFAGPTRMIFLDFVKGTDVPAAIDGLGQALADDVQNVLPADVPVELTNLSNVQTLPWCSRCSSDYWRSQRSATCSSIHPIAEPAIWQSSARSG